MFTLKHRLLLACTFCISACATHSTDSALKSTSDAPVAVEKTVTQWATAANVPGVAVAYINNQEVQWVYTYGKANPRQNVSKNTLFNIASLTKPMFSMMSLQLVEHDKLDLDESLSQYWIEPDIKDDPRHKNLTPRLALSHQTGFTNWRGDKPLSFMFTPGQRHEYSGEGFEYLKNAIERKLDKTMPELMETYVTRPLNMQSTFFGWQENLTNKVVDRYDEQGEVIPHKGFYRDSYSAACCTLSSVIDYAGFINWVAQGADLSHELLQQLLNVQAQHDNPIEYFGLGWRLVQLNQATYLMHDGRELGVRSFTTVSPDTGEGLVILTNSSNGELLYRPILQASLKEAEPYLAQTDKDTWRYLTSLPAEMQSRMLSFIAQSPSFVSKALYAANETVFSQTSLSANSNQLDAQKIKAQRMIDKFVLALIKEPELSKKFLETIRLLSSKKDTVLLQQKLQTTVEIKDWLAQLKEVTESIDIKQ